MSWTRMFKGTPWEQQLQSYHELRDRGLQLGDVVTCADATRVRRHKHTNKPHVRVRPDASLGDQDRGFVAEDGDKGLVAYVSGVAADAEIPAGTQFSVVELREHSARLRLLNERGE